MRLENRDFEGDPLFDSKLPALTEIRVGEIRIQFIPNTIKNKRKGHSHGCK